jgi:hypothetical protein
MLRPSLISLLAATLAALVLFAARVNAQEVDASARAVARDLGYAGVAAFERGEYQLATEKLERAFKLLEAPSLGLWSARALVKLGKLVQAAERYRLVGRIKASAGELEVQRQAQQDAAAELATLEKRIPTLVVLIEGASAGGVALELDDAPFAAALMGEPVPVNPGSHRVTANERGHTAAQTVSLAEAERKHVTLRLGSPMPAPQGVATASPPANVQGSLQSTEGAHGSAAVQRLVGWGAVGIGAAAIVVGTVTGAMAMNDRSTLSDRGCSLDRNQCPIALQDDVASYNRRLTISSVAFIGGSVLAAAGAVVLLTVPTTETKVAIHVRPSAITFSTAF